MTINNQIFILDQPTSDYCNATMQPEVTKQGASVVCPHSRSHRRNTNNFSGLLLCCNFDPKTIHKDIHFKKYCVLSPTTMRNELSCTNCGLNFKLRPSDSSLYLVKCTKQTLRCSLLAKVIELHKYVWTSQTNWCLFRQHAVQTDRLLILFQKIQQWHAFFTWK